MKQPKNKTDKQISISIDKVELISHTLDIPKDFEATDKKFTYNFQATTEYLADLSQIVVVISYKFINEEHTLFAIDVNNVYNVKDLQSHMVNEKLDNDKFLKNLIRLSIDHTRGVQSVLIAKTKIEKFYMPIINTDKIEPKREKP